jgi:uncharacterized protein YcfJ
MNKTIIGMTITAIATTTMIGCNKTQQGMTMGAIVGQAIGGDTKGTVIGAAAGAFFGSMLEEEEQQQTAQMQQQQATGQTIRRTTVHETLNPDGTVTKTGTTTTTSSQTSDGYTGLED